MKKKMTTDDALKAFERNMLSRVAHLVTTMYRRYNIFPHLYINAIEIRVLLSSSIFDSLLACGLQVTYYEDDDSYLGLLDTEIKIDNHIIFDLHGIPFEVIALDEEEDDIPSDYNMFHVAISENEKIMSGLCAAIYN